MFTNTLLLWFLPLALVPIILHLLALFRIRTVELSTYRFLMDSYVQQRWRLRLLEYLLMFLRAAFVALIVLSFSRPVVQKFEFLVAGGTGRDVTIIVDAGATMTLRTGGKTSLERAQDAAKVIVDLLGPEDHVTVIRAGRRPQTMATGFALRTETINTNIAAIKPDPSRADLSLALSEALSTPARAPRMICVLTGGGRTAWSDLEGHPALRKLGPDTPFVVMNVGPSEPVVNVGVLGEPPRPLRAVIGLPVLLEATVANCSRDRPADATLSVMLDDKRVDYSNVALQPAQTTTLPFTVTPTRQGLIKGSFSLSADAFADDDAFLFCLNVEPRLEVLIVIGQSGPQSSQDPGYEVNYINAAMTSSLHAGKADSKATRGRSLADALSVTTTRLREMSRSQLEATDVVILDNAVMKPRHGRMLRQYVESGGGLLIFPGSRSDPADYAKSLLRGSELPKLGKPVGDPDVESSFSSLGEIDLRHPVLSAFDDPELDSFSTVQLYRYFPIEADATATGTAKVLVRLPDQTPILVEAAMGEGKILLAGFAATPNWSNLPLKPEYVPLLLRSVAYLRRPTQAQVQPAVRPHMPASLRLTESWSQARVEATDPDGQLHPIDVKYTGNGYTGTLLQTGRKGYYSFMVEPPVELSPERIELAFAVNLDTSREDFETLNEAEIGGLLAPVEPLYLSGSPDDPTLKNQLTQRREIWRLLIWVLFCVIGVEFFLATLRPSRGSKGREVGHP